LEEDLVLSKEVVLKKREEIYKQYCDLADNGKISEYVAILYSIETLDWVLGLIEVLPAEQLIAILRRTAIYK